MIANAAWGSKMKLTVNILLLLLTLPTLDSIPNVDRNISFAQDSVVRLHCLLSTKAHQRMCCCPGLGGSGCHSGPNCRRMYSMLPRDRPRLCPPPPQQQPLGRGYGAAGQAVGRHLPGGEADAHCEPAEPSMAALRLGRAQAVGPPAAVCGRA